MLVSGTSSNIEVVVLGSASLIAFARIFAASARVIGASGWNPPSEYPFIHPFFTQNVIYSAYHLFLSTSENPESVPMNVYRHERDLTSIFTNSARVTDLVGSNNRSLRAIADRRYAVKVAPLASSPCSSPRNISTEWISSEKSVRDISVA